MKFTVGEWQTLSKLFDEAMDVPEEARSNWLASLDAAYASLQPALRHMLLRQANAETDEFLNTLPKFDDVHLGDPAAAPLHSLSAELAVGPYRLVRELGRGGMGAVWLAERIDGLIKRPVALKLPHPAPYNAQLGERFSRERDILASLVHPNIGKLFDAGVTAAGQSYLALEYVEGATITEYSDRVSLPVRDRLQLFLQVLEAVQYAHSRLVIHRDLKPSNILVTDECQVVLLDFGIAKLVTDGEAKETELTQRGGRALTPDYASPEQIAGQAITTASDVYSLGIVLYELLTGERPYKLTRDSRGALEEAILAADPRIPSQVVTDRSKAERRGSTTKKLAKTLHGDLDTIVLKSLKKAPNERYATADAFAQDIERYLAGQPVLAQPESIWYRSRKFLLRNKFAVASTATVFAALAAGFGVALWQAHIARTEAKTAEAVQTFLEDIFRANSSDQADPLKARQTTARELLDIGAKKIDGELDAVPEAKISTLKTLADMYHQLHLEDQGANLHRKRVQLTKSVYGNNHPQVVQAMIDLSQSLFGSKSFNEQGLVLKQAMDILDHNKDSASETRAKLLGELAQYYLDKDLTKALAFARQGVQLYRAHPASDDLIEALVMQGLVHNQLNERRSAEALFSEAVSVSKVVKGQVNAKLPRIYAYLAESQYYLQEFAAAEQSYRLGLEIARTLEGEEDMDTIQLELRLGYFLFSTSRPREGLTHTKHAMELVLKTMGTDDPWYTPMVAEAYGWSLAASGQLEEGLRYISLATESWRKHRPESAYILSSLERQAAALIDVGHYSEAQNLLDQATAIRNKIHDETTNLNGNIEARSKLLAAVGKSDEAAKVLEDLRIENVAAGQISLTWVRSSIARAEADLSRGRVYNAVGLAARVREELTRSPSRRYFRNYEAQAALVEGKGLLLAGRPSDALPLLTRAVELSFELYDGERSPVLANAQIALASCFIDLGQRDQAKKLFIQAEAIHATHKELGEQYRKTLRDLQARVDTPR